MREVINFIDIPEEYKQAIGAPDPGTRLYRQFGHDKEKELWWDAILSITKERNVVSPGGASSFVGVSRTAVHKRIKEGRLTAFAFHTVEENKLLKKINISYEQLAESGWPQILYIPWSELKDWRNYINSRKQKASLRKKNMDADHTDDKFLKGNLAWKNKKRKNDG
ncbi:hypothetical protein [Desulfobacula toluolica]|uniref:Uncharacterized protein n=1 Tax=Desulfobacula toluolica (strain DSM 7467 / Tol2) TaxID=651182 RepID=K0NAN0_DESTT|nr:hypothetical protein [Desulfobacula toluolica]CCK81149.1 uncharacterized protein TOL2_C29900 [Desulfobacula toluolica Tol2]